MPQESDTLINGTLCPLLADKFVGGILVWHVIPSLRLLRRNLIDVHRFSSDPRHRCAKDLIPTLFVSLRIWSQLALLIDLLLVRTDGNILLHWQKEHSPDNSSLWTQIRKCLEEELTIRIMSDISATFSPMKKSVQPRYPNTVAHQSVRVCCQRLLCLFRKPKALASQPKNWLIIPVALKWCARTLLKRNGNNCMIMNENLVTIQMHK